MDRPGKFRRIFALIVVPSLLGCAVSKAKPDLVDPIGCCCAFGDCRDDLSQSECVKEAEFQGWTYTWHAGKCNEHDYRPAPDR